MLILALDTTTRDGSIALMRDQVLVGVETGDVARTHGERLPADISRLLTRHNVPFAAIDLYAVAAGPGSFTGLRIGIATMQGLAFANGKPLAGISALDALAMSAQTHTMNSPGVHGVRPDAIAVWMDAQRQEVFAALYRLPDLDCVAGPACGPPVEVLADWQSVVGRSRIWFVGDGAVAYRAIIAADAEDSTVIEPTPVIAPAIAILAARDAALGRVGGPETIRPLYVRRPDAELARDRARAQVKG